MSMNVRPPSYRHFEDVISGIGLILFALAALWVSRDYSVGTASNMGPGYFPRALCAIIAALGAVIAFRNIRTPIEDIDPDDVLRIRPLFAVAAGYLAFALFLRTVGLLPAVLILIVISGLAVRKRSATEWILIVLSLEALTFGLWQIVQMSVPLIGGY